MLRGPNVAREWIGEGGFQAAIVVCAEMMVRALSHALRQAQDEGKGREAYGGLKCAGMFCDDAATQALILSLSKGEGGMAGAMLCALACAPHPPAGTFSPLAGRREARLLGCPFCFVVQAWIPGSGAGHDEWVGRDDADRRHARLTPPLLPFVTLGL
ncbi:hypothetical protein [Nitratireductor sp.]|uniref:hypothetical protein n=1 Tax=Nitratireductor sp. TaxID=1872084 RepID=UPI00262F7463|nr:hypothetical protein [Nitratireductor sp.]MCV0379370.1 hypothetical protein [Nitratireductor sp.]